MKREQAVKASAADVRLHIRRQAVFGENMARGADRPRLIEVVVTLAALCILAFAAWRGWLI